MGKRVGVEMAEQYRGDRDETQAIHLCDVAAPLRNDAAELQGSLLGDQPLRRVKFGG